MDVILIMVYLPKPNQWIVLGYLRQLNVKVGKNSLVEDFLPKLSGDNYVVFAVVEAMGQVSKLHTYLFY